MKRVPPFFFWLDMPTDAELAEAEAAALDAATTGVSSFSSDGASAVQMDPMKQLDVVDRLKHRQVASSGNVLGKLLRHSSRIISPGGGGE